MDARVSPGSPQIIRSKPSMKIFKIIDNPRHDGEYLWDPKDWIVK